MISQKHWGVSVQQLNKELFTMFENKEGGFLKVPDITRLTKISKTAIYEKMRKGEFPRQIKIGTRTSVWNESEVREWMREQCAKRTTVRS